VVVSAGSCIEPRRATRALTALIERFGARGTAVEIRQSSSGDETFHVVLLLRDAGRVERLTRSYDFSAADCREAVALFAVVVERALREFPQWDVPDRPAPEPLRDWRVGAAVTALGALDPALAELALSTRIDYGGAQHRFGVGLIGRFPWPRKIGAGRVAAFNLLLGAGWTRLYQRWSRHLEVRGGALWLGGTGFDTNKSLGLWWTEGSFALRRHFGDLALGAVVAASPQRYRAVTSDGSQSRKIGWLRVGLQLIWAPFGPP
jgi:hypothetical protein